MLQRLAKPLKMAAVIFITAMVFFLVDNFLNKSEFLDSLIYPQNTSEEESDPILESFEITRIAAVVGAAISWMILSFVLMRDYLRDIVIAGTIWSIALIATLLLFPPVVVMYTKVPPPDSTFEWPPPRPSAFLVLPRELVAVPVGTTVEHVAIRIRDSLMEAGFPECTFYGAPQGLVFICRPEQILNDGSPSPGLSRWQIDLQRGMREFSIPEFLRSLFRAPEGRYRTVVFVITDQPFVAANRSTTRDDTVLWYREGSPVWIAKWVNNPFTPSHYVVALIYEFHVPGQNIPPDFINESVISGAEHLRLAGIYDKLKARATMEGGYE